MARSALQVDIFLVIGNIFKAGIPHYVKMGIDRDLSLLPKLSKMLKVS